MITTINLYGTLGRRFGKQWRLDVRDPAEVIRAIDTLKPGFARAIIELDCAFRVCVGRKRIGEQLLQFPNNGKTISIAPVLKGAASGKAIGEVILGVVLVAVGVVLAATGVGAAFTPYIIGLGLSLTLGGISALLAPAPPTLDSNPDDKHKASYQFNGPINTIQQGAPVPYCFGGPVLIGSAVVSAGSSNSDILDDDKSTSSDDNSNSSGQPIFGSDRSKWPN